MEKRMLDDDKDACKILAMLLEPIVSGIFEKMKKEQERDTLIQSIRMSECQPKIFNEVSNSRLIAFSFSAVSPAHSF